MACSLMQQMQPPFVSVCTPTFNRRPFIAAMMQCFNHQTYPRDRMEWVIVDDGTDPIEDLVSQHPCVQYFRLGEKISLGKKRNMMHEKARGDIIAYMDDDDYYPPERVSHAVTTLLDHRNRKTGIKLAGSSEMYIYFKSGELRSPHPSSSENLGALHPSSLKKCPGISRGKGEENNCKSPCPASLHEWRAAAGRYKCISV